MVTIAHHWFLSYTMWIQSTAYHPVSLTYTHISSSSLCLGLPHGLFPSVFPTTTLQNFSSLPHTLHALPTSLGHSNNICKTVQIMKLLLIIQFSLASCISLLLHTPQDPFLTHSQFLFFPSRDRDQVLYPLNTTDETRNLLSLAITFIFPNCREEENKL